MPKKAHYFCSFFLKYFFVGSYLFIYIDIIVFQTYDIYFLIIVFFYYYYFFYHRTKTQVYFLCRHTLKFELM